MLEDISNFNRQVQIEAKHCFAVQHVLDVSNFIQTVKPFVCLNYDSLAGGFSLKR